MPYKSILLIEDDETDQIIFTTVLQSLGPGFTCTVLDDTDMALYQLETAEISADLIFLDVNIPGMSGLEFLRELRKNETLSHIAVVVMSGMLDENDARESGELGALGYIIKPTRYNELKKILSSILL